MRDKGFLYLFLAVVVVSCKTQDAVTTVIHEVRDTVNTVEVRVDSIIVHDSVSVKEQVAGDTVKIEIERWHTKYKIREVHDTISHTKWEKEPAPYPVKVEVPAQLTVWQNFRMHLGNMVIWSIAIFIVIYFIRKMR